jgi:hypothetical protein
VRGWLTLLRAAIVLLSELWDQSKHERARKKAVEADARQLKRVQEWRAGDHEVHEVTIQSPTPAAERPRPPPRRR